MDPQLVTIIERAKAEGLGDDVIRLLIVEHERRTGGTPPIVATKGMIPQSGVPSTYIPGIIDTHAIPFVKGMGDVAGETMSGLASLPGAAARKIVSEPTSLVWSTNNALPGVWQGAKNTVSDILSGEPRRVGHGTTKAAAALAPLVTEGAALVPEGTAARLATTAKNTATAAKNVAVSTATNPITTTLAGMAGGYYTGGLPGLVRHGMEGAGVGTVAQFLKAMRRGPEAVAAKEIKVPITPGPGTTMTGMGVEPAQLGGMSGTTTPTLRPSIEPALRPHPLPTSATGLSPLEAAAAQPNMMGPRVATPAPVPLRPSVTGTGSVTAGAPPTTGIDTEAWMRSMRGRLPATVEPVAPPKIAKTTKAAASPSGLSVMDDLRAQYEAALKSVPGTLEDARLIERLAPLFEKTARAEGMVHAALGKRK